MNHARILHVTNWLLNITGYQVHHFDTKSGRYRLSMWAILHFVMITLLYLIAFSHHFELSSFLQLMQSISPFLKFLIRLQLLMGLKIYLLTIYEFPTVTRATNELASLLPTKFAQKFSREEAFVYFLNFSTLVIASIICLYVAMEMKFELPPLDNILIFTGLLIPHLMLSGALKMYYTGIWLLRQQMWNLKVEFQNLLSKMKSAPSNKIENDKKIVTMECEVKVSAVLHDLSAPLKEISHQLHQLSKTKIIFNAALQRQLLFLMLLNSNCLLAGTYMRVYYETTWHTIFTQITKNIFQATNFGIFILIGWDYFLLGLIWYLYEKVKLNFNNDIQAAVQQRHSFTESTSFLLTDIHDDLKNDFNFKLAGFVKVDFCSIFVLQVVVALIIALIVLYHYLNDQILILNERFDDQNDDEE